MIVELLEEATRRLQTAAGPPLLAAQRATSGGRARLSRLRSAWLLRSGRRGDAPAGAACAAGVAIGPAGAGFFCARSATVTSIARSIGIRATPLFLSTHAYVVRSFWVSSRNAFNFSMRFFARVSS